MARPVDWHDVFGFDDPTPGDVYEISAIARRWGGIADAAEMAESKLRGWLRDDSVASWIGKAGDAFAEHSSELPDQLGKAKDSYRQASEAMSWWSSRLDVHQGDADAALVKGRTAKSDLASAQNALQAASGGVSTAAGAGALTYDGASDAANAPTSDAVRDATNKLHAAQAAQTHAQGLVNDAQSRLDAARTLASDAGDLRRSDGKTTAGKVHDAADAGIKPRSSWQKFKDGVAAAWKVIVEIAKVVVLVLGVVALIIGGPLAWIVFAAALIVLADTIMKYVKGQATLLDVALAALACIPGTKGLTTLSELSAAFKAGGLLGAGAHVLVAGKNAIVAIAGTVRAVSRNIGPGLTALKGVFTEAGSFASVSNLRSALGDVSKAFFAERTGGSTLVDEARNWQTGRSYHTSDDYAANALDAGHRLEAGFPGISNYAVDGGAAARHGNDASSMWESVQVGPGGPGSAHAGYRSSMIELHVNSSTASASGATHANPQFGAGGETQHFLDIKGGVANGSISVLDHAGNPITIPPGTGPRGVESVISQHLGGGGTIHLTGAGQPDYTHVMSLGNAGDSAGVRNVLHGIGYAGVGSSVGR